MDSSVRTSHTRRLRRLTIDAPPHDARSRLSEDIAPHSNFRSRSFWWMGVIYTGLNNTKLARLEFDATISCWPWPFKFAAILNMPAFIAGLLVSWPLDSLRPGLPESVSMLPTLLFVTWLWYPIGSWADRTSMSTQSKNARLAFSISFLLFTLVCATAASISAYIGSYTSYLVIGTAIWLTVTIGVNVYPAFRKRIAKGRLSPG